MYCVTRNWNRCCLFQLISTSLALTECDNHRQFASCSSNIFDYLIFVSQVYSPLVCSMSKEDRSKCRCPGILNWKFLLKYFDQNEELKMCCCHDTHENKFQCLIIYSIFQMYAHGLRFVMFCCVLVPVSFTLSFAFISLAWGNLMSPK